MFLEEQKAIDGAVEAYTFASTELRDLLVTLDPFGQSQQRIRLGVASGYNLIRVRVNSINENYLSTVDTQTYYQPVEIANNKKGTEVVQMLYQNDTLK
jgi:hypothetical protein